MKVNRQDIGESYNITVDWIDDFANKLEKNADFLSNVRSLQLMRKNKFSSVDDKIKDIKSRVGFDIIKNNEKLKEEIKVTAGKGCACGGSCDSCSTKSAHDDDTVFLMDQLMGYIKDIIRDAAKEEKPPEATVYSNVLNTCRQNPKLKYHTLEGKINHPALEVWIDGLKDDIMPKRRAQEREKFKPNTAEFEGDTSGDIADYFQHGMARV